jgi:hypothetical protein
MQMRLVIPHGSYVVLGGRAMEPERAAVEATESDDSAAVHHENGFRMDDVERAAVGHVDPERDERFSSQDFEQIFCSH